MSEYKSNIGLFHEHSKCHDTLYFYCTTYHSEKVYFIKQCVAIYLGVPLSISSFTDIRSSSWTRFIVPSIMLTIPQCQAAFIVATRFAFSPATSVTKTTRYYTTPPPISVMFVACSPPVMAWTIMWFKHIKFKLCNITKQDCSMQKGCMKLYCLEKEYIILRCDINSRIIFSANLVFCLFFSIYIYIHTYVQLLVIPLCWCWCVVIKMCGSMNAR